LKSGRKESPQPVSFCTPAYIKDSKPIEILAAALKFKRLRQKMKNSTLKKSIAFERVCPRMENN